MANVGTEPEHSVIFVAGDDFNFDDDPIQSQRNAIRSAAKFRGTLDRKSVNQDHIAGTIAGATSLPPNTNTGRSDQ